MNSKIKPVVLLLLLCVSLATAAEDFVVSGCRRSPYREELALRRALGASGAERKPGGDFYHGDRRQLVVLASFADRTFLGNEAETLEQWDKIFNAVGLDEAPFVGSLHDYFHAQSYGQLNLQFDLHYVQLPDEHAKYGSTIINDENSQFLVKDVVDVLGERDIDWSLYDWNGDGYVNQLLIVFAGKGSGYGGFGGGFNAIWPHQLWMTQHKDPSTNEMLQPLAVTNADGSTLLVDCYCAVPELRYNGTYSSFGIICHEYSHCFGFPDFYSGATNYVGGWDIMGSGYYNNDGFCPSGYSAHERWLMGWLTPTELTETAAIADMPDLSEQGTAYLIRNEGCNSEYYMVENRQQKGWDAGVPGSGILVYHIDYDANLWTGIFQYPNTDSRQHYVIIPANNSSYNSASNAANWAYPYADNNMLTNTSEPAATLFNANTDGSMLMNKSILDISVTDGLASFNFTVDDPTAINELSTVGKYQILYDLGAVCIVRCQNGEIKKVVKQH